MAEIDDKAFDYMNAGDPDKYITGGTMEHSECEMDMSPEQQEEFLRENASLFRNLYNTDPLVNREKLPYSSYLENFDPELISLRAQEYDESRGPRSPEVITSKAIWDQAGKHGGGKQGIESIRDMVLGK